MKTFVDYLCERAWEVVPYRDGDRSFESSAQPDEYYYHVTLAPSAKSILSSGALKPNAKKLMGNGGFSANSKGRVFITDRGGVSFWASRAEDHAFDQFDNPPKVTVLRIPKKLLQGKTVTPDDVGSRDAHAPAYYVTGGFQVNEAFSDPRIAKLDPRQKKTLDQYVRDAEEDGDTDYRMAKKFLDRVEPLNIDPALSFEQEIVELLIKHANISAYSKVDAVTQFNRMLPKMKDALRKRFPGAKWSDTELLHAAKGYTPSKEFGTVWDAGAYLAKIALKKGYKP